MAINKEKALCLIVCSEVFKSVGELLTVAGD